MKKTALKLLIKVLYDEFNNIFLNVEFFFVIVVIKFVIQQKLFNLQCIINSNKENSRKVRAHNCLDIKRIKCKRIFISINI